MEGETRTPDSERDPRREVEEAERKLGEAATDLRAAVDSVEDFDKRRDAINDWAKKWQSNLGTASAWVGLAGAASFLTFVIGITGLNAEGSNLDSEQVHSLLVSMRAIAEQNVDAIRGAMYGTWAMAVSPLMYAAGTIGGKIAKGVAMGKVRKDERESWTS